MSYGAVKKHVLCERKKAYTLMQEDKAVSKIKKKKFHK